MVVVVVVVVDDNVSWIEDLVDVNGFAGNDLIDRLEAEEEANVS